MTTVPVSDPGGPMTAPTSTTRYIGTIRKIDSRKWEARIEWSVNYGPMTVFRTIGVFKTRDEAMGQALKHARELLDR